MAISNTPIDYLVHRYADSWVSNVPTSHSYTDVSGKAPLGSGMITRVTNRDPSWKVKIANRLDASQSYQTEGFSKFPNLRYYGALFFRPSPSNDGSNTLTYYKSNQLHGMPSYAFSSDSAVDDLALSRLKRKLNSQVGDMPIMAPIAELRELRQTVKGSAALATGLIETLSTIRKTKGKSAFRYASDAWLTYSFGIKPLIADTKNIAQSISDYLLRTDKTSRLTGTASRTWIDNYVQKNNDTNIPLVNVSAAWSSLTEYSCRYTAGFDLKIKSANDYGIMQHFHLELPALVPVFWELMAYSWVVDYFTTTGAFLDDLFTSDPSKCLYVVKSQRYTVKSHYILSPEPTIQTNQKIFPIYQTVNSGDLEYYAFRRTPLAKLPNRALRFKTLDEVGLNSVNRLLNLSAVFIGGRAREYRPFATSTPGYYQGR